MLATIRSAALRGLEPVPVTIEVSITNGLPAFHVVGLPDAAVRESRERVVSALRESGFQFPLKRITANLAYTLRRLDKKLAVGSACIGGGQGIAVVLERM